MPETTMSGCATIPEKSAHMTASAGLPATAKPGSPVAVVPAVTPNAAVVNPSVVPLWLVAGATISTIRFGLSCSSSTTAAMPGAPIPSSLVTRTRIVWPSAACAMMDSQHTASSALFVVISDPLSRASPIAPASARVLETLPIPLGRLQGAPSVRWVSSLPTAGEKFLDQAASLAGYYRRNPGGNHGEHRGRRSSPVRRRWPAVGPERIGRRGGGANGAGDERER